jgi:hypothetical protein
MGNRPKATQGGSKYLVDVFQNCGGQTVRTEHNRCQTNEARAKRPDLNQFVQ